MLIVNEFVHVYVKFPNCPIVNAIFLLFFSLSMLFSILHALRRLILTDMQGEVHTGHSQTCAQASQPTPYTDMLIYLQFLVTDQIKVWDGVFSLTLPSCIACPPFTPSSYPGLFLGHLGCSCVFWLKRSYLFSKKTLLLYILTCVWVLRIPNTGRNMHFQHLFC